MRYRLALAVFILFVFPFALVPAQDAGLGEAAPPPLKIWLPAPLIADESGAAYQLLSEHTAPFSERAGITVQFRIKEVGTVGGIMSTIRTGSDVAPGALPDLTLIRRRDFTPTQARQYFQSLETMFSSSLINELGSALTFGQIPLDSALALYGLPYFYDLLLAIYTPDAGELGGAPTFDDVLASGVAYHFPAARSNGLNQTTYLQYLSAGGSRQGEVLSEINEVALLMALEFYEALVAAEQVSPDALAIQSAAAYLPELNNRAAAPQIAIANASDYLSMLEQNPALAVASIPTAGGLPASALDGWLWVIVTPDLSRQSLAARYLEWLMEPVFHARLSLALQHLPTQSAALADSLPEAVDRQFFADLLASATPPLPEGEGGAASRLMQEALARVLHGEATATAATKEAIAQFAAR
ncbi:MAG: hypothetical protein F4Y70_00965 [Chloroflexi bacterium]|nr:hypothetical protein [Chloroflexota bacterium]MXX82034.1 hypothetical protein [Chloroflexota bacterium]MYA93851.1 hypothetical protein [Chloroflexota bacterium]MYC56551.1 hypothetical protein [Chloroflexota bacterium]MYE79262.1 hypothetical protein [Chloroflexota bacterium]